MSVPTPIRSLTAFLLLWLNVMWATALAIEEPVYAVLERSGKMELRAYEPMIIAEVEVNGDMKQASNRGFRLIADFIFGNNTVASGVASGVTSGSGGTGGSEKISMTAPVTMQQQPARAEKIAMTTPVTMAQANNEANDQANDLANGQNDSQWRMHFVMPREYTMATLPTPNNPRVQLREIPPKTYAVIRFSGFTGDKKVQKKTAELMAWLSAQNLSPTGPPELARYNPPITPPFFRRNEVMIPVSP
ncbi:SOUL family heme-binding protein [Marinicella meishanensis]|uniref:SOUL family heme-binding protein n=1 Tax=Marinicella meishanensis TaxID=2873263 RepID=UPI001CC07BD8|nr:heme-binding protein [Marinicella sp. NBU2979]